MVRENYLRRSPLQFDDTDYQFCYEYWLGLKGERWAPAWHEWDWMALPLDLIPYFLVVDVSYEPLDFVYRFWGTAYNTMHSKDFTNLSIREIRSPIAAENVWHQYEDITNCQQAIGTDDVLQTGPLDTEHRQVTLRMPMSDTGEKVDQIVTFADWRKDQEQIKLEHLKAFGET